MIFPSSAKAKYSFNFAWLLKASSFLIPSSSTLVIALFISVSTLSNSSLAFLFSITTFSIVSGNMFVIFSFIEAGSKSICNLSKTLAKSSLLMLLKIEVSLFPSSCNVSSSFVNLSILFKRTSFSFFVLSPVSIASSLSLFIFASITLSSPRKLYNLSNNVLTSLDNIFI